MASGCCSSRAVASSVHFLAEEEEAKKDRASDAGYAKQCRNNTQRFSTSVAKVPAATTGANRLRKVLLTTFQRSPGRFMNTALLRA